MTSNSTQIIHQIQEKMSQIITTMTGETTLDLDAYDAETQVLESLLSLGRSCLTLYFETRARQTMAPTARTPKGQELPYHSHKTRTQMTLFGAVVIKRPYFYKSREGGYYPLDEQVNLPEHSYSDALQEMFAELAVGQDYRSGTQFLTRWFNLSLSTRTVQQFVTTTASDATSFYEHLAPPPAAEEGEILVAQADGKGVPLILPTDAAQVVRPGRGQARSRKKEAIVTAVYTQTPRPRTAEGVVASLFKHPVQHPPSTPNATTPVHKVIQASLDGKEAALQRLQNTVAQRDQPQITHRIALCDGAHALQKQFADKFPTFTLVLDFIHAYEYLWKAANILFAEADPRRVTWVEKQTRMMLSGATPDLIILLREQALETSGVQQEKLEGIANYFERNLPYMQYDSCLRHGLPIASGVIEGACRHIVKDRMELSGMRWSQHGAEQLLKLRCVHQNGHWDSFWEYHRSLRKQSACVRSLSDLPLAG
jgi:hypothetical protein